MKSMETLAAKVQKDPARYLAEFKAAAAERGWQGHVGHGVSNHITGEKLRSWQALAIQTTEAARVITIPLDVVAEPATEAEPAGPSVIQFLVTRTDALPLTDRTWVSVEITEATALTEGKCESGAALGCTGEGFRRILPESMLPGSKRESMIQCLPCYEASADAYARKLHHYTDEL